MAKFTMNIDDELKQQASELYDQLGMTLTTAITVFLKQSVREGRMPFQPSTGARPYDHAAIGPSRRRDPEEMMEEVRQLQAMAPKNSSLKDMTPEDVRKALGRA